MTKCNYSISFYCTVCAYIIIYFLFMHSLTIQYPIQFLIASFRDYQWYNLKMVYSHIINIFSLWEAKNLHKKAARCNKISLLPTKYLTDSFMVIKQHNMMHSRMHYCCCVSQFNCIFFLFISWTWKHSRKSKLLELPTAAARSFLVIIPTKFSQWIFSFCATTIACLTSVTRSTAAIWKLPATWFVFRWTVNTVILSIPNVCCEYRILMLYIFVIFVEKVTVNRWN